MISEFKPLPEKHEKREEMYIQAEHVIETFHNFYHFRRNIRRKKQNASFLATWS